MKMSFFFFRCFGMKAVDFPGPIVELTSIGALMPAATLKDTKSE
jgi:hypothetical protein